MTADNTTNPHKINLELISAKPPYYQLEMNIIILAIKSYLLFIVLLQISKFSNATTMQIDETGKVCIVQPFFTKYDQEMLCV